MKNSFFKLLSFAIPLTIIILLGRLLYIHNLSRYKECSDILPLPPEAKQSVIQCTDNRKFGRFVEYARLFSRIRNFGYRLHVAELWNCSLMLPEQFGSISYSKLKSMLSIGPAWVEFARAAPIRLDDRVTIILRVDFD